MAMLDDLESTRSKTLEYFDLNDPDLAKSYGPGKWTVRYLLNHLSDCEVIFLYRIRRVISQPNQVIWVVDQDAWAQALDYATAPLDLARSIFDSSRAGIIDNARRHYDRSASIPFVHSATGLRTLKDEFDKVASHNQKHLAQIAQALSS